MKKLLVVFLTLTACSAKNPGKNDGADGNQKLSVPLTPTFQSLSANVFPKCLKCHGEGSGENRIPFDSPTAMVNFSQKFVVPGKPQESQLWLVVKSGLMPKGSPLAADEVSAIETWIKNGAL